MTTGGGAGAEAAVAMAGAVVGGKEQQRFWWRWERRVRRLTANDETAQAVGAAVATANRIQCI